jgi:hypothetical protein
MSTPDSKPMNMEEGDLDHIGTKLYDIVERIPKLLEYSNSIRQVLPMIYKHGVKQREIIVSQRDKIVKQNEIIRKLKLEVKKLNAK